MGILERSLSAEQKRGALEQVLQGNTFSRAEQLKRFLRYICEMEIAGRAHEVKEYSIATKALGHSVDYSSADGSSVRTRAHSLRQKLQEYYESENPDAEIQISLQKGSYIPAFVPRPEAMVQPQRGIPQPETRFRKLAFVFGAVALAILAVETTALILVSSRKAALRENSEKRQLAET